MLNRKDIKIKLLQRIIRNWYFWTFGFLAFIWILVRSGTNPKRLTYPCQQVAYPLASAWLIAVLSLFGGAFILKKLFKWSSAAVLLVGLGWFFYSYSNPRLSYSAVELPTWEAGTSAASVSNIYLVDSIPLTSGSLAAGNSSVPTGHLSDEAMDSLVSIMNHSNIPFFKSSGLPNGIVGENDIVLIKANFQWRHRLGTNTDRIKGLIWQILNHPDGFGGEILVVDNQESQIWPEEWLAGFNDYSNNSDDLAQSIVDVTNTFKDKGYPVDFYVWDSLNPNIVNEYSTGDLNDGYIYDPTVKTSYPKFRTPGGTYVSFSKGIWDNTAKTYSKDNYTIINFPVLKAHGLAGATIALKNYIGVMNTTKHIEWFDGVGVDKAFHPNYCFSEYALVAKEMAIAWPDLNIVDASYVATASNSDYNSKVVKQGTILASTDPIAVSWYAAKHILTPIARRPERTNPDGGTGGAKEYAPIFGHWYNYLKNNTSFQVTRDETEMSIITNSGFQTVDVTQVILSSDNNITKIRVGEKLQFSTAIVPANATDPSVRWYVTNGTGSATINNNGLLSAVAIGTVTVHAESNSNTSLSDNMEIQVVNSTIEVESVTVLLSPGKTDSLQRSMFMQLNVAVLPSNASDNSVSWRINEVGGQAVIDQSGKITGLAPGPIWAVVTSNSKPNLTDSLKIQIVEKEIPVESITVQIDNSNGSNVLVNDTLQVSAHVTPDTATNKEVDIHLENLTGKGVLNANGILIALLPGLILIKASSESNPLVADSVEVNIEEPFIPLDSIQIRLGADQPINIPTGDQVQLYSFLFPANATNRSVTWEINEVNGTATMDQTGKFTALTPGLVRVIVNSKSNPAISDSLNLYVIDEEVPMESITVSIDNNEKPYIEEGDTVEVMVNVVPVSTTDKRVSLSLNNSSGKGMLMEGRKLIAIRSGLISVKASSQSNPLVMDSVEVNIRKAFIALDSIQIRFDEKDQINIPKGAQLQLQVIAYPANATNKSVKWSVLSGTGKAQVDSNGVVTAMENGNVWIEAVSESDSGKKAGIELNIVETNVNRNTLTFRNSK